MSDEEAIVSIDIMDVAYIAIGVRRAVEERVGAFQAMGRYDSEYVEAIVDHAPLLGQLWLTYGDRYEGPWFSRVAEEFGYQYAKEWAEVGEEPDAELLANVLVKQGLTAAH